jgi:hypothetical protein
MVRGPYAAEAKQASIDLPPPQPSAICRQLNSILSDSKRIGDAKKRAKYSERLQNI